MTETFDCESDCSTEVGDKRKKTRVPVGTWTKRNMSKDDNWEYKDNGFGSTLWYKFKDDDKVKFVKKIPSKWQGDKGDEEEEDEGDTTSPEYRVVSKGILLTWSQEDLPEDFYTELLEKTKSENWHADAWAITQEKTKEGRPHYHTFLITNKRYDRNLSSFEVAGVTPGDCQKNKTKGPGAIASMSRGLYYVIAPKTGTLQVDHNEKALDLINQHYKSTWARTLCATRKLPLNMYKTECLKYLTWTETMERDFNRLKSEVQTSQLQSHIDSVNKVIQESFVPYRKFEEMELFEKQFLQLKSRYNFLIIAGASKTGKSEFAVSRFKNPFEHKGVINWKGYDHEVHDGIIIHDVATVFTYILKHRELFQSNNGMHTVNSSDANAYAFQVYLHRKPIIVVCNYDHMRTFNNEWLDENSYCLRIPRHEVTYVTPEQESADINEEEQMQKWLTHYSNHNEFVTDSSMRKVFKVLTADPHLKRMIKVRFEHVGNTHPLGA